LSFGGMCEKSLPSTYSVWKIASADQCKAPSYSKFVYTHPKSGVKKSLLAVDYEARELYALSKTTLFQVYKNVIISLWLLAMLFELKDITIVFTWVLRFPGAAEFGEDAVKSEEDEEGNVTYTIQGIQSGHRMMVGLMNLCRFILTMVLTVTGCSFLLKSTDYVGLLMDAVALVFIVEIAIILYGQVLRPEIREQAEGLSPMTVKMYGIDALNRRPALVDFICLVTIGITSVIIMNYWTTTAVNPVYDSLSCACLSEGEACHEYHKFSYDFWFQYWKEDVPAVFKAVDELKKGAGGGDSFAEIGKGNPLPGTLLSKGLQHRLAL